MSYFADLVRDTSTTTGTGDFTITGTPPSGAYVAFGSATEWVVGELIQVTIRHQTLNEWEDIFVPLSTSTNIQRSSALTRVIRSSNAGALVNFSAGTKDVYNGFSASYANAIQGQISARHLVMS